MSLFFLDPVSPYPKDVQARRELEEKGEKGLGSPWAKVGTVDQSIFGLTAPALYFLLIQSTGPRFWCKILLL